MNPPAAEARRTLGRHLLVWTLGAQLAAWTVMVAIGWSTSLRETRKFTDGHLVAVAQLWMGTAAWSERDASQALPVPREAVHEYAQDVAIMVWDNGRLVTDSDQLAGGLDLARLPEKGLVTLEVRDAQGEPRDWRAYVETHRAPGQERRVAALLDLKKRYVLAEDIAEHLASPSLILLPLVALVLWWTIRRGLRPLDQLSDEVAALDAFAGQRLDTRHRFTEFSSTVTAINTMVDTLQAQAGRERQFASDVAHELRTPLAVITLQARAAQVDASPERLARLEQEALRAGRILTQLLDLARAQRASQPGAGGQPAEAAQPTALGEVAARLLSAHAQLAHESRHEMSLNEEQTDVRVQVQPMLLELALRNLIENALRHTPPDTQVEVTVWRDALGCGVSVSDDGQRAGAAALAQASSGLGLGLRLVERIAEQMGARLVRDSGVAPMTTRFSLRWDASTPTRFES